VIRRWGSVWPFLLGLAWLGCAGSGSAGGLLRPALSHGQAGDGAVARPVHVRSGLEVLLEDSLAVVKGKRLGLVTNPTGRDRQGRTAVELLAARKDLRLLRLFAPEHGLDGTRPAGEQVRDEIHEATGLPVTSLYQGSRTVDPSLFAGLDMVLFDVQDIGIRPYTFTSTLAEVMKGAARADIDVVVLDRPNPLGGTLVAGLSLEPEWASFIGLFATPYVHGLTAGEWARLVNREFGIGCRLRVIPAAGWRRGMDWAAGGLPWLPASPNVPTADTPLAMAVTGPVGELGSASIGIGTAQPFWLAGTDSLDADVLVESFNAARVPGLRAIPWSWTPTAGSWSGRRCRGMRLLVTDAALADPGLGQLALLEALRAAGVDLLARSSEAQRNMFCKALGTRRVLDGLRSGASLAPLRTDMARDVQTFRARRAPYLLYPE
jgi:uncharacterized protein YbbC (DUF1343 family)